MDCKTARKVWNHPRGFIAGVREHLPGVVESMERQVGAFARGETCAFDTAVKAKAGDGAYYIEHADTEDNAVAIGVHDVVGDVVGKQMLEEHLSALAGQPISIGNMCCSSCIISDGPLHAMHLHRIQIAAVNTDPVLE